MTAIISRNKFFLILGLFFILTLAVIIHIVQYRTNSIIEELTINRVQMANVSLKNYLTELEERAGILAEIISLDEAVIAAVKNRDNESLKRYLKIYITEIDFASICDPKGMVLVRTHSDIVGDDVSNHRGVSTVLRTGLAFSSLEQIKSNNNNLSITSSAPIYDGGEMIGIVNCNYDLSKNEHMDAFKERTGCEATIFRNNLRLNTTIRDETGESIIGTSAFDFIVETVIEEQKEYFGYLNLFGRMYGVCYSPLISNDEIVGILSTAVDIENILSIRKSMNSWILGVTVIGILLTVAFVFISERIMAGYTNRADKQLNQQMLMANISRNFLTDAETNSLITETLQTVGEFMNIPQVLLLRREENIKWEKDNNVLICCNEWINPKTGLNSRVGTKVFFDDKIYAFVNTLKPGSGENSYLNSNDPVVRQKMASYRKNFQNYICAPIFVKGELNGIIDFSNFDKHEWNENEISFATFLASILSGVFEREAMEKKTSIVENSPHMIFYYGSNGDISYANPAASAITGFTMDELIDGGQDILFDEKTISVINEVYIPNTLRDGMDRHEIVMTCKDGKKLILEMTSFVLNDENIATIAMDLTEIRTLQGELINAKNTAEMSSLAKSEFLSNMSHEMRTPMNAIIGMTAIARNTTDIDRKDYALSRVEESSKHLLAIINDVLDMSKIEANKFKLTSIKFDIRKLVQKAVSLVSLSMESKRIRFSMKMAENMPSFYYGDDQRLTQVLMNLLSNAVKFTPEEGEIKLNVSFIPDHSFVDENLVYEIIFEVTDTGIGISRAQKKKIFKIFEQAESGTTRKFGGTGLGLSISKQIVELMDGKIYVESEPGKGSSFIFTVKLPCVEMDSGQNDAGKKIEFLSEKKENIFSGKKILFAEDVEINREILISLLENTGIIIDTAENGREALEKYTSAPDYYDLVLMDIRMPEMDGIEATQRIREFESEHRVLYSKEYLKSVPIIAMTANVFKDDIDNCIEAGMNDHIGKPLEIDILFEKLNKYLFHST